MSSKINAPSWAGMIFKTNSLTAMCNTLGFKYFQL
jgi:hypothetical protein